MVKLNPWGPDAERLDEVQGLPVCSGVLMKSECRVGAWSANEKDEPTHIASTLSTLMTPPLMRDPAKRSSKPGQAGTATGSGLGARSTEKSQSVSGDHEISQHENSA